MPQTTIRVDGAKQRLATKKTNRVKAGIREQVIALLGKPKDLYRVDIHLYRAGRARVNVWRREMVKAEQGGGIMGAMGQPELVETTRITDTHYLWLSKSAIIESANPPIERRY